MLKRLLLFLFPLIVACVTKSSEQAIVHDSHIVQIDSPQIDIDTPNKNVYDFLFDTVICSGFDFPVGTIDGIGAYQDIATGKEYSGWYKVVEFCEAYMYGIHPAEDWNGIGGGNTDMGQTVYSIGKGIVKHASNVGGNWGNVVVIEHAYYENGTVKKVQSLYAHLDTIVVEKGKYISRRFPIGTIGTNYGMFSAHLHFEIRKESMFDRAVDFWPSEDVSWIKEYYEHPTRFIDSHRAISVPADDTLIAIAVKHEYRLYLIKKGKVFKTYPIALGQDPKGHKKIQGDNRTPEGEYYINQKSLGPFSGDWADFFGTAWIRISYPNSFDAESAYNKRLISSAEKAAIIREIMKKGMPPKNTAIGGGIGIHGWSGEWDPQEKNNLTWGCISINNDQLLDFYKLVPINTRILIIP